MKKINICFVTQFLSIGGIETRLLKILSHLDRNIFNPVLLCARDDGLQADKFKELNIPIITTKGLFPFNRLIQLKEFLLFMARCRFKKFDVVMSFLATSFPFENMLARYGCKKEGFIYALVTNHMMGREKDWKTRAKLAGCIVSVSEQAADFFYANSKTRERVTVIYNGIDTRLYDSTRYKVSKSAFGLPEDKIIFCCVARVDPLKQYNVLVNAVKAIGHDHPDIHIVIAGQDKLDGWLQKKIIEERVESFVTYLGHVYNVPELLSVCDGMVSTSVAEGCPNSILEGMAMSLPIVTTKSGAEEFVKQRLSGYVVPVGDSETVAERIKCLALDKGLREKMGAHGRKWVLEHCTLNMMLRAYDQLFMEVGQKNT